MNINYDDFERNVRKKVQSKNEKKKIVHKAIDTSFTNRKDLYSKRASLVEKIEKQMLSHSSSKQKIVQNMTVSWSVLNLFQLLHVLSRSLYIFLKSFLISTSSGFLNIIYLSLSSKKIVYLSMHIWRSSYFFFYSYFNSIIKSKVIIYFWGKSSL